MKKEKDTILLQVKITKQTNNALEEIVEEFKTKIGSKPSKRLIASTLLEMAIASGEPIIITNEKKQLKNEKIS
jgi:hypothetical protein